MSAIPDKQIANTVRIACRGADALALDSIEDFQGGLKKRGKKEIDQIITSLIKFGFSFPFFVWQHDGHNYCIDGHGRLQALAELRRRGASLPVFPVAYIEAVDEPEAKQKLLRLNSQYGSMSVESVMEFLGDGMLVDEEISLPGASLDFSKKEIEEGKEEILRPYEKIHVLISFHPSDFARISDQLDFIKRTEGIEYEQSAN